MDSFDFDDLAPIQIPVRYAGVGYVLREASEGAARQYRNAVAKKRVFQGGELVGFTDPADVEVLLVSLCLCKTGKHGDVETDAKGNPITVSQEVLSLWPGKHIRKLFTRAKEISRLGDWEETDDPDSLERRMGNDFAVLYVRHPERAKEFLEKQTRLVREEEERLRKLEEAKVGARTNGETKGAGEKQGGGLEKESTPVFRPEGAVKN